LKYASHIGIAAALLLILCCFIPWAYYPDLQQNFTGFYSMQNQYGKPGKTFIFLSIISIALFLISKLWAKRWNQFVSVLIFAYALKCFIIFAACYLGICPEIRSGLIGMLGFSVIVLICSLLSKADVKLKA
jgi:hypothetical protein